MICPTCGTHIPDGSLRCPACHASVGVTMAMPSLQGRWCPSCGSGVSWDDEVCPSCGMPLEAEWGSYSKSKSPEVDAETPTEDDGDVESDEASETRSIPRIESAIPPEDDSESRSKLHERLPRTRVFVVAALAAALVVSGLVAFVTRPWDEDKGSGRATVEADTSMAGFPGTVDSLSGQDSSGSQDAGLSGDELTLFQLNDCYDKLGKYAERANGSEAQFDELAFAPDVEVRMQGKREVDLLAVDVSNLVSEVSQIDVSSGQYVEEREHMLSLANWLRNRVDTLAAAWKASYESSDPAADAERIRSILTSFDGENGQNAYKVLFETNYPEWQPQPKGEG
ncbi:MAG: zinc ribbon domain-containing protein [Atopobiaceae bacterium]|nr:zinc ribbon domain-containing protein [Atopobiaceae bacterium]